MIVVPKPLPNCHISPSWTYPCYQTHLLHRRLPTAAAREEDLDEEETGNELDVAFSDQLACEDSEEEDSFIDTQEETQQSGSGRKHARKKKKGRRVSAAYESDQEPSRHPLSQRFHENRNQQRIDHHPAMAPKRKQQLRHHASRPAFQLQMRPIGNGREGEGEPKA